MKNSDERILEFKQWLIDEKVFELPKIFKELKYIFNGLVGVILSAENSEGVTKYLKQIIKNFIIKIILQTNK